MFLVSSCACLHYMGRCILILQRKEEGKITKVAPNPSTQTEKQEVRKAF